MSSADAAHLQRWTLIHPVSVVGQFVRGNAIPEYFVANPAIGSPLGAESDWDGVSGGRIQAFTGGCVGWDPAGGARMVTE